jgi:hypothetical protein
MSGPAAGSSSRCGRGGADEPVAEEATGVADALHLAVLAEGVRDLQVARLDLPPQDRRVEQRRGVRPFMASTSCSSVSATTKSAPVLLERPRPDRARPC